MKMLQTVVLVVLLTVCIECHVHSDYEQPDLFMDRGELESLFQVMEALNEEMNWRKNYPHPCTSTPWPGIHCEQRDDDGFSHVTRIDFGTLPNSTCKQNATLSHALSGLGSLRSLFVINCFVSTQTTIPPSLYRLSRTLEMLSLRGNSALVGGIPPELGRLSRLEVLSLSQNGLTGEIPLELGLLGRIEHVDLSYNRLNGNIPAGLGSLRTLNILDLNNNALSGSIPSSLGDLAELQKLDLSSNRLTGRVPSSLGKLSSLKFLALSENRLTGELPQELSRLAAVEYLILHDNPMNMELPDFWGTLGNLSELSLSNSGYYGRIPKSFEGLLYLSELSLEDNILNGSIPAGLGRLPNMYHLNLSNNQLSGPVPFERDFLYRLGENLDLRGNVDLCLTVRVPKNVSTKNLSSCKSSGIDSSATTSAFACSLILYLFFFAWGV